MAARQRTGPQGSLPFQLKSIQLALFVRNLAAVLANNSAGFAGSLTETITELSTNPTILPIPGDAPPDIPRIMLKSEDREYECNVSSRRIDFFVKNLGNLAIGDFWEQEVLPKIQLLSNFVVNRTLQVSRVGFIANTEAETAVNVSDYLRENFIREDRLRDPLELKIRFIHREQIGNINANVVANFGQVGSGLNLQEGKLFLQLDINITPESAEEEEFTNRIIEFTDGAYEIARSKITSFPAI